MSAIATGVDVLGHVMTLGRIPTRLLDAEDTFFKVIAHRMSLYEGALSSEWTSLKASGRSRCRFSV